MLGTISHLVRYSLNLTFDPTSVSKAKSGGAEGRQGIFMVITSLEDKAGLLL
ncbi:unnamed protein product [marine sediment metagenome]|uniref:Uncharacterized protein n=1 Tax=marine sediment metagenome TaxID=412755 RepID=X1QY26_9ZZZZ